MATDNRAAIQPAESGKYLLSFWQGKDPVKAFMVNKEDHIIDKQLGLYFHKMKVDDEEDARLQYGGLMGGYFLEWEGKKYRLDKTPFESDYNVPFAPTSRKRKLVELDEFDSPLSTRLPQIYETGHVEEFLAPDGWLSNTAKTVLEQAELEDSNNPRVSPVALVRCSRGGKTRSMTELAREIRTQDPSYGIVLVSFNTDTGLNDKKTKDPTGELCVRIAFTAYKGRQGPGDREGFLGFYESHRVTKEWVVKWLGNEKCILFIDELNMLEDCIGADTAVFIKEHFLVRTGRGVVFSSHVASINQELTDFMSSPNERKVISVPLPTITSVRDARVHFNMNLSVQDALFLGMLPGLIVEKKNRHQPRERQVVAVSKYLGAVQSSDDVCKLLKTLLTGDVQGVDPTLQELMTADLTTNEKNEEVMILRWVPFHMSYVMQQLSSNCPQVQTAGAMAKCLGAVDKLFVQFSSQKSKSGDAWEALFLIVLIIRCVTGMFDDTVLPLGPFMVAGRRPLVDCDAPFKHGQVDFYEEENPVTFVDGIPHKSPVKERVPAISIYYPGAARFKAYDMILAVWDFEGNRYLYGYQLKEGSEVPRPFAYDQIFHQSYLIRGNAPHSSRSARLWRSVSAGELRTFFGESASQWSAEHWRRLTAEAPDDDDVGG